MRKPGGYRVTIASRPPRLCFTLKARQGLHIPNDVIGQEFERNKSVEGHILRLVDDPHSAATKLFNDPLVRDALADH